MELKYKRYFRLVMIIIISLLAFKYTPKDTATSKIHLGKNNIVPLLQSDIKLEEVVFDYFKHTNSTNTMSIKPLYDEQTHSKVVN